MQDSSRDYGSLAGAEAGDPGEPGAEAGEPAEPGAAAMISNYRGPSGFCEITFRGLPVGERWVAEEYRIERGRAGQLAARMSWRPFARWRCSFRSIRSCS
ncbi:hypothetical protein [Paenibacillus glycinis]|uniref:Uncharacterized protein n=1 Tax=Paenibacillus glycinis TaxID=2697035 RepID=A0ABW9XQ86_9BACL|nr:hypothetical protein [Paenibacillus glycinis]NBD24818.1 hypothetical protein [Paenibacillus glycinis]